VNDRVKCVLSGDTSAYKHLKHCHFKTSHIVTPRNIVTLAHREDHTKHVVDRIDGDKVCRVYLLDYLLTVL